MARAAGITDKQLRHRDVVRLSRDTYLPRAMTRDVDFRIAAVLMTAPSSAVVSHATAAALWGLAIPLQVEELRVHLTVAPGSAVRGRADRVVHRSPVSAEDVTTRRSFRVATPERTWRDLAAVLAPAALLAVTDQLLGSWSTREKLAAQLGNHPSRRGSARARAVLAVADPRAESPMESVLRWLLHEAGVPAPVLQHEIRTPGGSFRVDFAWPDRMLVVEFDGNVHRDRGVFVKDVRRQNELVTGGWTVLRFTSADVLGRPEDVVARIRRAVGA
jgi:very-short-patch-repair endonuclease